MLDGVYTRKAAGATPVFQATDAPSASALADILPTVRVKIRRRLPRRGLLREEGAEEAADPDAEEAPLLTACYAASVQGTAALGPKAGHYVGRRGGELAALPDPMPPPSSWVRAAGYTLHAGGRVAAGDRGRLERLGRYGARPALAQGRLRESLDKLRHPWADGTDCLVFEPLTLMAKLVALVPRPRSHLRRRHGVLARRSSGRAQIVPRPSASKEAGNEEARATDGRGEGQKMSWAQRLRRVFSVDVLTGPRCGSTRRMIAVVMDPPVVRTILEARGLRWETPERSPARPPPQRGFEF